MSIQTKKQRRRSIPRRKAWRWYCSERNRIMWGITNCMDETHRMITPSFDRLLEPRPEDVDVFEVGWGGL